LAAGDTVRHHRALIDPTRQSIVQIDVEPRHVGWSFPVDCGLVGDARMTLEALARRAAISPGSRRTGGDERVRRAMEHGGFQSPESFSTAMPLLPQRVIQLLFEALPEEAIVTADAGENRIFLNHHFQTKSVGGFLQPASTGGMGYAIASALGVKLACPARRVVAVLGDGGFAMSLAGLMTSLEQDLQITVVVLNNGMLGWVRHLQGNRAIASELGDFDYAAIAQAFGCRSERVERAQDFVSAIGRAMKSDRSTVIEVMVSGEESWEKVASSLRLAR
jgi:acetolactate synthase-1/2/3 large subunit